MAQKTLTIGSLASFTIKKTNAYYLPKRSLLLVGRVNFANSVSVAFFLLIAIIIIIGITYSFQNITEHYQTKY
jgi:hypothetical protein